MDRKVIQITVYLALRSFISINSINKVYCGVHVVLPDVTLNTML